MTSCLIYYLSQISFYPKISQLEQEVKETSSRFMVSERTLRESARQERRKIEEERSKEAFEYNEKLNEIETKYQNEISLLKEIKEQEMKVTFHVSYQGPVVRKPDSAIHRIVIFSSFLRLSVYRYNLD